VDELFYKAQVRVIDKISRGITLLDGDRTMKLIKTLTLLAVFSLSACFNITFSEDNEYLQAKWETTLGDSINTTLVTVSLKPDAPEVEVDSLRFEYDIKHMVKETGVLLRRESGNIESTMEFSLEFTYHDSLLTSFSSSVILYEKDVLLEQLSQMYIPIHSWETKP